PPHLVGLAGAALIAVGLVLAVAAHTRFAETPRRRLPRVILLLGFADLVHKAMVALDHYTLDAWGRTPDFYPFLLALFLPAIFMAATRALGPGAAAATAAIFTAEHVLILLALLAFGMRVPTFTPIPLLPALAIEPALAALPADPRPGGGARHSRDRRRVPPLARGAPLDRRRARARAGYELRPPRRGLLGGAPARRLARAGNAPHVPGGDRRRTWDPAR